MTPLVPPDVDLRDFAFMPLEVMRVRLSDNLAVMSGDGFKAAVLLWCYAWHQVPAGSVPNDDGKLAHNSGFGRDVAGWQAVREEALHGFVLCDDGRLYHRTICEKAIEAWELKWKRKKQTRPATEARTRNDERDVDRNDARNVPDQETVDIGGGGGDAREVADSLADQDRIRAAMIEAAGPALRHSSRLFLLPLHWFANGCDLEADVLPTLRALGSEKLPGEIMAWAFFERAVYETRDRRLRPPPPPMQRGPPRRAATKSMTQHLREAADELSRADSARTPRLAFQRD